MRMCVCMRVDICLCVHAGALMGLGMFFVFACGAPALALVMRTLPHEYVSVGLGTMQVIWKCLGVCVYTYVCLPVCECV